MARRSRLHGAIVAVSLIMAVGGLVVAGQPTAVAEIPGFSETRNVADDFHRAVADGFGTAPTGGRYVIDGAGAAEVKQYGELRLDRPGTALSASLAELRTTDQRLDAVIDLPELPAAGNGVSVSLEFRRQGQRSYLATARVAPDGSVTLAASRQDGSTERELGAAEAAGTITAGQRLTVQAYLTGRDPVEIGLRAQPADAGPGPWLVRQDADSGRIVAAGSVGVRGYLSRGTERATVRLHQLQGARLTPAGEGGGSMPAPAVGSVPVGQADYPVPDGAIFVAPAGDDAADGTAAAPLRTLARAVAVAPDGATIVLRAGSYTEQVATPAGKRLTVQPYPREAVWLDGSAVITRWEPRDGVWVTPLPAEFDSSASHIEGSDEGGFVDPDFPMAAHPDQVFVDGEPLTQLPAGSTPKPGEFVADYDADLLIIGDDPAGHELRASVLSRAVVASGHVTLRGIGVRRYATSLPKMGTIYLGGKDSASVLENLVVEDNATQGISVATGQVVIDRVTSRDNGMVGLHAAYADGLVIRNCLITGNNTQRFNQEPAAAGIKVGRSRGVTLTGNRIEDNHRINGIWLDESVVGFTIARNTVRGALPTGILAELSDTGVIAGNDVVGGREGITLYNTGRVTVANNVVRQTSVWDVGLTQDERRQATHPVGRDPRQPMPDPTNPWQLQDITVINNVFAGDPDGAAKGFQFYGLDKRTNVPLDAMNVVIDGNLFSAPDGTEAERMAAWGGDDNETITVYRTPRALAEAKNPDWTNLLTASVRPDAAELDRLSGSAVPLPEPVALALDRPVGSRLIGPPEIS